MAVSSVKMSGVLTSNRSSGISGLNSAGQDGDAPPEVASSSSGSHLQLFVKAKKKINLIYEEMSDYVTESTRFFRRLPDVLELKEESLKNAEEYSRKISAIREVLDRNHMKVVFFGRTSNGKSTAINALLGNRILPTGIGHTTSCFLRVEGGNEAESFILTEGSEERKGVESIGELAHALHSSGIEF